MFGPGRMRVLGGVGGLVVCGVAGVTVAASPKPAGAPLNPPVDPPRTADATAGLVIPATPVCGAQMPDQRLQNIAQRRARMRTARCTPAPASASATSDPEMIEPQVVDAAPLQAPVTDSYVS